MSEIAHSLVRRAVDVTQQHYETNGEDHQVKRMAIWGMILLWATAMIYMATISAVSLSLKCSAITVNEVRLMRILQLSYTYGEVVAALTMIETPTAAAYTTASESDNADVDAPLLSEEQKSEKQKMQALEADLFLVKQTPVTAKLRTAVKHLTAVAGPFARFRGLQIAILYSFAQAFIVNVFAGPPGTIFRPLVSVLTSIVLCRLQMTWTHTVISMPSEKSWWRRFPSYKAAKNIILPTAVWAIARQVCIYIPAVLFSVVFNTFKRPEMHGGNPQDVQKVALVQMLGVSAVCIAAVVLILVPAEVTLKRVQASMLPEEDEAIVPFDRTFAGKVTPTVLGGTGAVSMLEAWKSFDKASRIRLLKLYMKLFAIQTATTVMFFMIFVAELRLILGGDFEKMVNVARKNLKGDL